MAKRNDQGREVWFERVLWSYMPTHWKGVVYPAIVIGLVVPLCLFADQYDMALSIFPLFAGWAFVMWLCSRHSQSRR